MDSDTKHVHAILRKAMILLRNGLVDCWSRDVIARRCSELLVELDRTGESLTPASKLSAFMEWSQSGCVPDVGCGTTDNRLQGWNAAIRHAHLETSQISCIGRNPVIVRNDIFAAIDALAEPADA